MAAKISNWLGTRSQRSHLSAALPISNHVCNIHVTFVCAQIQIFTQYLGKKCLKTFGTWSTGLQKDGNGGNVFPANLRFWQPHLASQLK